MGRPTIALVFFWFTLPALAQNPLPSATSHGLNRNGTKSFVECRLMASLI